MQLYTGDGKGKTTAAFGLALRASGQGHKVLIFQFLKPASLDIGEQFALQTGKSKIRIEAMDLPWDMKESLKDPKTVSAVKAFIKHTLQRLTETAAKRFYDVIILDEIVYCLSKGLSTLEDIKKLIDNRDSRVEIVLTGRGATPELIALADLVTEMKNIKHPFDKGITGRQGIEF